MLLFLKAKWKITWTENITQDQNAEVSPPPHQTSELFQNLKNTEVLPPFRESLSLSRWEVGLFPCCQKTQLFIRSCDASKKKESELQRADRKKAASCSRGSRAPAGESSPWNKEADEHLRISGQELRGGGRHLVYSSKGAPDSKAAKM